MTQPSSAAIVAGAEAGVESGWRTGRTNTHGPPPWTQTDRECYRFTVEQYHRLANLGFRPPPGGVELLEGLIVLKWPPWGLTGCVSDQYRWSVDKFHRLIDAAIMKSGDPVVL